ncbi:nitrous oxide reductase accessory protein NosL [Ulvibacter antarcticus]|uniref:Copper chaperone NosL n=1 Tax=Ulvibacter antarcticus TaxID=442714 RepID=A0A3L9YGY1_9FLAO|nr:nitrous oxide reductase accessory protein NosL [Ulvibacter antarcticus]RMA58710.1 copper chaperone NosL [Ulvibacter antarcticus]
MKSIAIIILFGLSLGSCNTSPQPIEYGNDGCHYCKMTIVDRQHASQLVTSKGKAYKFDAIECMIGYLNENKNDEYAHKLVSDFVEPGKLIDAQNATFLISQDIPSPMGAFLSAFASEKAAVHVQSESGGNIYNWKSLQEFLKSEKPN